jgi:predicted deacylase
MTKLSIVDLNLDPGQRATSVATVSIDGRSVPVPIIGVAGAEDGPRVAITGGIHGAEYVGIEAARRVGMTVDPAEVRGSLVVVPISNTTAYRTRSIYTSALDDRNLNREFPGDVSGTGAQVLANWLFTTVIKPSDYYIDMHGGDMIEALVPFVLAPKTDNPALDEASMGMARACGIQRIIHGGVHGSTVGAAVGAGIPAILPEIGGQGVWSEELVTSHMESTLRVLRHLGVLPGEVQPAEGQAVYDTFAWMRAEVSGLFHPTVAVGDQVQQGQDVGTIVDYFGNPLQPLRAVATGEVVFLVTSLAMNDGDPILAICT